MEPPMKIRKFIVKLKPMSYIGTTPEEIRERILDNRIKECRVYLPRVRPARKSSSGIIGRNSNRNNSSSSEQTRRCCVRLPRITYGSRSEIASTPSSSIVHADSFDVDFTDILQDAA